MSHGGVSAFCYECEAEGPPRSTEEEAMESWNRRSKSAQAQRVPLSDFIEKLAQSWDGCMYDAPGEYLDIGAAIRSAARAHGITQDKT